MRSNRGKDTGIEVSIRSALHRSGLRFLKHRRPLPDVRCEADIVFPRLKLAVFIDGCFWHGCPQHATRPVTHGEWWAAKLDRTMARDIANRERLQAEGWSVLRVWEHDSSDFAAQQIYERIALLRTESKLRLKP
jgi:DNA mismatch endonuclease, patch repair protein